MPSVFTRRAPSSNTPLPAGTIPSPSASALPILSTGIPSLDDVLGSGQPLNSILSVLAPDTHSAWGKLIARYYIAEGLALGQDVMVIGGNDVEDLEELVKGCMWMEESAKRVAVTEANAKDPGNVDGDDSDAEGLADDLDAGNRMRIAWRYDNMKKFETSVSARAGSSSTFHLPLNLTTPIPRQILSDARASKQLQLVSLDQLEYHGSAKKSFREITARMNQDLYEDGQPRKKVLRIVVYELGGPEWGDDASAASIHRFLYPLRHLLRIAPETASSVAPAVALVTYPADLSANAPQVGKGKGRALSGPVMTSDAWLKSIAGASDACVELQGFASDPNLVHSFPHSHGLVHVRAFPTLQTLLPPSYKHSTLLGLGAGSTGQNNLSFRLKRKRFVIETLHLGVEGGVGERRTEPTPTMKSLSAGGGQASHTHTAGCSHGSGDIEGVVGGVEPANPAENTTEAAPAVKVGARFAAMDIAMEDDSVRPSNAPQSEEIPKPKKERRKVAFIQDDKPELYEF